MVRLRREAHVAAAAAAAHEAAVAHVAAVAAAAAYVLLSAAGSYSLCHMETTKRLTCLLAGLS